MPPIELSLGWIFSQATGVVQGVLVVLILCSAVCWGIIVEKVSLLLRYRRQVREFNARIKNGAFVLSELKGEGLPGLVLAQGRAEWDAPRAGESDIDRRDRTERAMRDALSEELMRVEARLPYLATIGSAAPFIGLFGTVWGIMHSFISIAQTNDTSLAVVAPGIAESLFTTAAGLAAAIPASVAYNKIASDFRGLSRRLSLTIATVVRRAPAAPSEDSHEAS